MRVFESLNAKKHGAFWLAILFSLRNPNIPMWLRQDNNKKKKKSYFLA